MIRQLRISKLLFNSIIEENKKLIESATSEPLDPHSVPVMVKFLASIESKFTSPYQPIDLVYRFEDKRVDDGEYCLECFDKKYEELTEGGCMTLHVTLFDREFDYSFDQAHRVRSEEMKCCSSCEGLFDYKYVISNSEVEKWAKKEFNINSPKEVWILKKIFNSAITDVKLKQRYDFTKGTYSVPDEEELKLSQRIDNFILLTEKILNQYKSNTSNL